MEEAPISVLNADDASFDYFRERARDRVITYGIDVAADLRAGDLEADATGTRFHLESPRWHGGVRIGLPGRFNVSNALAALAVGEALDLDLDHAARALGETAGVPGRMERVDAGQPFAVIVDYAHTADSLRKVLSMLRPVTRGRLIVVFGSAGERDPTKRPAMGRVAAELADAVVVTDEDPRLEDARAINEQIAAGARAVGAADGETLWVIDDRREAIGHAVGMAQEGDVVLLAGKGHEACMFYGTEKRPWDDRLAAREAPSRRTDGAADDVGRAARLARHRSGGLERVRRGGAVSRLHPAVGVGRGASDGRLATGAPRHRSRSRPAGGRGPAPAAPDARARLAPRVRAARTDR